MITAGTTDSQQAQVSKGAEKGVVHSSTIEDLTPQGVIHVLESSEDLLPIGSRKRKAIADPEGDCTASASQKVG